MEELRCAYGTLEFRAVDDAERVIEGVASTDMLDDFGTILEPAGARFSVPLPLLWQHERGTPVGEVISATVVDNQIRVRAQIATIPEPGPLKDAVDRAWQAVKHRLVRGLSVGFLPLKRKGNRFIEWTWRELSLVTLPSNVEATISSVRSSLAASGAPSPDVSGTPNDSTQPRRKMTTREQIQQHENSRASKVARQAALMERASTDGETLAPNEAEEYDTLTEEIEAIDGHIARLSVLERSQAAKATPVPGTPTPGAPGTQPAAQARGGVPVVRVRSNIPPGMSMAMYASAIAVCRGHRIAAAQYARNTWGDVANDVANLLEKPALDMENLQHRAATAAGTTTDSTWAAPLAVEQPLANEFLELLRPTTLLGRIPGLKNVPFNISLPAQTAGGVYGWTGQGKAKRVTKLSFDTVRLGMAKATGIIVLTKELVRSSQPAAQAVVRDDMIAGIGQYLDEQFVDPTVTVSADNPASITNGVTGFPSSGSTQAQILTDLLQLVGPFVSNNFGLGGVVLLMNEGNAFALRLTLNAVGGKAFPGVGISGGDLEGIPVVTSNSVGDQIVAVHAPSVLFADAGIELDSSEEASLQMDSEPAEPSDANTVMISMFQRNMVALRAERFINWKKARAGAVRRITDVNYIPADDS